MNESFWQKACVGLLILLVGLAGWGLKKVYDVDMRTGRMEERMLAWHTPLGTATPAIQLAQYEKQMSPAQRVEFAQRSMVKAVKEIMRGEEDKALKTLLLALEDTGLRCQPGRGEEELLCQWM
jgi:hypothetical protein